MTSGPHLYTDAEIALLLILEKANAHRDMSDPWEARRWAVVADLAHKALGRPSQGTLHDMKRDMVEHQSYSDLVASGGIVEAP